MRKIFENLLPNLFGRARGLSPALWNSKVLWWNIQIHLIISGIVGSTLGLLFWIAFGMNPLFILGIICAIFLINFSAGDYLEIEGGSFGIITILGELKGSQRFPWILKEGDYRNLAKVPFFPEIFDVWVFTKTPTPLEYPFEKVKTSDGVHVDGTNGFTFFIEDPWKYADFLLSVGEDGLKKIIHEVSLKSLNKTFDDYTLEEIFRGKNASDRIEKSYFQCLEGFVSTGGSRGDYEKTSSGFDFFEDKNQTGVLFRFPNAGIAGRFYIKTFFVAKDVQDSLKKKALAEVEKTARIVKAEGDAEASKIEGFALAEVEAEKVARVGESKQEIYKTQMEIFTKIDPDNKISATRRTMVAELFSDAYQDEKIISIGTPNGDGLIPPKIAKSLKEFARLLKTSSDQEGMIEGLKKKLKK